MPAEATYIFTACTDYTISGVCTTTSQTIIGYDIFTNQLIGCMNNTGVVTGATETIFEQYSYDDCEECLSNENGYSFSGCCDSQ